MLLSVFQDLIKPQWRGVIETLKRNGGMPISELARATGFSYMAAKAHCESLTEAGYLVRTRLPRTEVGRPEVLYHLSSKANALFPQAGIEFTLELLDDVKRMIGESAPEKLLYQHFQRQQSRWSEQLHTADSTELKAAKLAKLRTAEGYASEFQRDAGRHGRLLELHNPLHQIFAQYPRAATLEQGMIEELLGTRVTRKQSKGDLADSLQVCFEIG